MTSSAPDKIQYCSGIVYKELLSVFKKVPDSLLKEAMEYMIMDGGKRARPMLVFGVAEAIGLDFKKVASVASAIEMIHTYSLIHDDLPAMDDDSYRRGKLTCHIKYSEATAVLAGDGLLNLAVEVIASDENLDDKIKIGLIKHIFNASGCSGMILGQQMDIAYDYDKYSLEEINKVHFLKTGAMFITSCVASGIIAGFSEEKILALHEIGRYFGLLFQIVDDIDDHKNEYELNIVNIVGLDQAIKMADEYYQNCNKYISQIGDGEILPYLINSLYSKITR